MEKILQENETSQIPSHDEEAEKILAAQKDPQAFGILYDHYAPPIYRYLLSRLGNIDAAQDVTSQTFLTAIDQLPQYKHRGKFTAWLFSIARSRYVDYIRNTKRTSDPINEEYPDPYPGQLNDLVNEERRRALFECIQNLMPQEQELLRLRYVADLSFAEMGSLVKKREDAVKKSFYRLLKKIKRMLEA